MYYERDDRDVREVQRVHYGEFVMRLVGSSGTNDLAAMDNKPHPTFCWSPELFVCLFRELHELCELSLPVCSSAWQRKDLILKL